MLEWIERRLLYFPTFDVVHTTAAFGPGSEDVWFGERKRLHGVFVPGRCDTTLLFAHGNGGNLSHRAPLMVRMAAELGTSVFVFDYQGYGRSAGRPSEWATRSDARAALAYLHSRPDVNPTRIVYYGESLGGAVMVDLATESAPYRLVVQSSFTSIADMTRMHYPHLAPLLRFASVRYDAISKIGTIRSPLLVVHGESDSLVPAEHGRRLYEAANDPKKLLIVPGAGHNDVVVQAGPMLWDALRDLLA